MSVRVPEKRSKGRGNVRKAQTKNAYLDGSLE